MTIPHSASLVIARSTLILLVICPGITDHFASAEELSGKLYRDSARRFADAVLDHGRDTYGKTSTPLFVDGLRARPEADAYQPALWVHDGETWVLSNFASQQPLMRLLDGLTSATGNQRYRQAAEDAARHSLKHTSTPNGLLYWGGHMAWDLDEDKAVGQYDDVHEMKGHHPYFQLLHRVDSNRAKRLMETTWASHVLDWERLDYNRHGSVKRALQPQWSATFQPDIDVPFPSVGGNLSFCNVTPSLLHAGTMLALLEHDRDALQWAERLAKRWIQGRDPETGLCGGQLSYRKHDRADDALGHVHTGINEAKVVASYHQTSRYHTLPLVQLQAGSRLLQRGGEHARVGRMLINEAVEDLRIYARECYDPGSGRFIARMTDGTELRWKEAKTDYYTPSSFAPRKPDETLFWGYCRAVRLTGDETARDMVKQLGNTLGLGAMGIEDVAAADARSSDEVRTSTSSWRLIYALLELAESEAYADSRAQLMRRAGEIGVRLIKMQTESGLFPRPGRDWARTGDEIPLALLHLAAALDGFADKLPPPTYDARFFHCEYDAPLQPHQEKRADARTYDHYVYYGE